MGKLSGRVTERDQNDLYTVTMVRSAQPGCCLVVTGAPEGEHLAFLQVREMLCATLDLMVLIPSEQ